MDKNLDIVADELFAKLRSQFSKVSLKDENGEPTSEPKLARKFNFDFSVKNVPLGSVGIDLSQEDGMVILFSNDVIEDQPSNIKKQWFNFIEGLREFTKPKMLKFSIRDLNLSNLDKRGETQMSESKLWGTSKTSYQDLGETKIIIKHTQPVNYDLPAGRTMHIENIFIENADGERFRYPYKHLNGARALAQHVSHGGTSYDNIGTYIIGLSEELNKLRLFKGYVERNPVVSEAMGDIQSKVLERIDQVKKEIQQLQRTSYYEEFSESFTNAENTEIPEELVNDWVDRLTIRSFNEELKNVFPYIYKLVGENSLPIKTLTPDDLLNSETIDTQEQIANEIDELQDFESYLNTLVGEGTDIFSNDEEQQSIAIQKLNELVSQEFPVGPDGSNAIESLSEIIDDKELEEVFKELADINPESDVRPILKDYLKIKDEENGTDILGQVNFPEPGAEPVAEPEPEATAEPAAPPAEPAPAAAPAEVPPSMPTTPGVAMAENLKRVIERAKSAGMTAEDKFELFGEEVTLADAIRRAGLNLHEFFDTTYEDSGDEVVEFVRSMFDQDGNTPKGPTGVLISVEKKFGEEAVEKAKAVMNELMSQNEMRRIQELSGISTPQEGFSDVVNYAAGKAGEFAGGAAKFADKKIQGYKNLGNKVVQKATQFGSDIAQGASDAVDAATAGYQQGRGTVGQGSGQAAQPASPQPNPKTMTPPASGQGNQPAKPQPNPKRMTQAQREDLDTMLRIAGLR